MTQHLLSPESIFAQAIEIPSADDRAAFLDQVCQNDAGLRQELEKLVGDHFRAGSFLERPAVALDPKGTAGWEMTESASGVGTVIGPYKLLEEIGQGGMGLVFVAEQQQPIKRRVALKIIKPGMDSRQVIARFEAERQALALMDHPNIAKVHDGGTTPEGRPYFVMELVKGTPITEYCDQHCLSNRQRLQLFLDVCHAVQHAHQKGIIHRDLKPSNVLVETHDVRPVVKVIDFGIAKATGQQLTDKTLYTAVSQMVGTPLYMSPEQAGLGSLDVDTRSDVYALGVLLYELLTGTTPFDSEVLKKVSYDEMRRIIREEEPPQPSGRLSTLEQAALSTIAEKRGLEPRRLSQQLRGELDWIVMKALEKDRNRRYESASALAADVQRYLDDEPVLACPPSSGYRFRKFARRNKVALMTAGVVAAALLIGTAVSVWQAVEANAARKLAGERLENEKEARHDAEAHFQKALKAVKRMLVEVGVDGIAAKPEMVQARQRLFNEALALFNDLIASNPRHSQAYCERGHLYLSMTMRKQARDDYKKAIECDPENAEALGMLGTMLTYDDPTANGKRTALTYLTRALELEPSNPSCYVLLARFYEVNGQSRDEATAYGKAAQLVPPGSLESYNLLGRAALASGDHRSAKQNFEKCLLIDPAYPVALLGLGQIHYCIGEFDQALTFFTKALESPQMNKDGRIHAFAGRAAIYIRQKEYTAALSDSNRAIDLVSNAGSNLLGCTWWHYNRRGQAHFYLKHYEQALADFATAVELRPDDLGNLSWIPLEDVTSCPDERFRTGMVALADKTIQFLETEPDTSEDTKTQAYFDRAYIYLAAGKLDQADRFVRDLLQHVGKKNSPKSAGTAGALALRGNILLKQQQYVIAEPVLRECLAIREQKLPDDWLRYNTLSMLGGALLGQRKYADAEPLLLQGYEGMKQREAKIPPQGKVRLAEAAERLVRLYEAINQPEKARTWREKLPRGKRPGS